MKYAVYYLILILNFFICWRSFRDSTLSWRLFWLLAGLIVAALPFFLAERVTFYYGLVANVTAFFWAADKFMGKGILSLRGIVGGILLLPLPIFIPQISASWPASLIIPTLGHLLVSGASWPVVARVLKKVSDDDF